MQVADVQDREILEPLGQLGRTHHIFPDGDALGVLLRPPIKPGKLQRGPDHDRRGIPIFDVKKIEPAAKYPQLVIGFDP